MAEVNLFLIFIAAIFFDLLIGDPKFIIHPVQVIGIYIKQITNFFVQNFGDDKRILFWGGLFIAFSSIVISFTIGKLFELIFFQSKSNFAIGTIIFVGLSSCLATKSLTSSVKEISNLLEKKIINQQTQRKQKEKLFH